MIRGNVVSAITTRNFRSYFSGVLGYLFIIVFCVISAYYAFNAQFFTDNQANLDQLSQQFPILLLFLIPAITMTTWSDEKKLGTDELLFTLPATEVEIVIGKYLAVFGVYTVALLFSIVNAVILVRLGNPDLGLLFSTYFGYWIAGASLLSAGMLASALTSSPTVAFVLGVIFCCIPVLISRFSEFAEFVLSTERLNALLEAIGTSVYSFRTALQGLSIEQQLQAFSIGVIPVYNLLFFAAFTTVMLYLNFVIVSKRRWTAHAVGMGSHFALRTLSIVIASISALSLIGAISILPLRADMTSERLFSLSDATRRTLQGIDDGQNITVQAFVSPEVPRDFTETRRQLLGLLREFSAAGGDAFNVREVAVEPFSKEAEQARALGITPSRVVYEQEDGRIEEAEVFMGLNIKSATDNIIIPFMDKGLPVEYELTRSVETVLRKQRKKVGILQTDAALLPTQTSFMGSAPEWAIVGELRKQYEVVAVDPSNTLLPEDKNGNRRPRFDVLLAVAPSSLTQPEMDNFLEYVKSGRPVLIFDDPLTVSYPFQRGGGITQAPTLPKPTDTSMQMFGGRPPEPPPKAEAGRLSSLLRLLKIQWKNNRVVYDRDNPHSQFAQLQPEIAFLSRKRGGNIFSDKSPITRQLQEVVTMFSGAIANVESQNGPTFTALLTTGGNSGFLTVESSDPMDGPDEAPLQATIFLDKDFPAGTTFKLSGKTEGYNNTGDDGITLGHDAKSFRDDVRVQVALASPSKVSRFGAEKLIRGVDVSWVSETEFKLNRAVKKDDVLLVLKDMRVDSVATLQRANPFMPQSALVMRRDEEIIRRDDEYAHIVAGHIQSDSDDNPLNAIFVADIDLIGDQFFQIRSQGNLEVQFDNVTFVLNAIDVLAEEDAFIELRSRRDQNRTLTYVERLTQDLRQELAREERAAEKEKDDRLEAAQHELTETIAEIENQEGLDDRSKAIKVEAKREEMQRKLDLQTEALERETQNRKRQASLSVKRQIRGIQNGVRLTAYVMPAILPLCFGLLFLGLRQLGERKSITAERRRK